LLSFIPSLGTREVFTFGPGVAMPTRMRFTEIAENFRPNSEASGDTHSDAGTHISRDLISSVIERWRSSSMSHRAGDDELSEHGSPLDSPALQPGAPPPPAAPMPVPPSPRGETLRSSLLRKPLESSSAFPLSNRPPPPPSFPLKPR